MTPDARAIFDDLATRARRWVLDHTHPQTGLTRDRSRDRPDAPDHPRHASIAATGFYLSLLPTLVHHNQLTQSQATDRAAATLAFVADHVDHVHGILRHFCDWETGQPWGNGEYSVLDTAIFLNGCMVISGAFPSLAGKADHLISRVQWAPLLAESPGLLSYGYSADKRILLSRAQVRSSENLMPTLLAVGAEDDPLPPSIWYDMHIDRGVPPSSLPTTDATYSAIRRQTLNPTHPLFTSYFSLCWADLKGLHDADHVDLWENAVSAARLNRHYCRHIAAEKFSTYRPEQGGWWGLSAGDAPRNRYLALGPESPNIDGTVWTTAAVAAAEWSLTELSLDLPAWRQSNAWQRALCDYGLRPFNLDQNWVAPDMIGVDLGSLALAHANLTTGLPRQLWSHHPVARRALARLDFSHAGNRRD